MDDSVGAAKILIDEGLFEQAKVLLRKALVVAPHDVRARKLLETAQELELKRLMSDTEPARRKVFVPVGAHEVSAQDASLDWVADEDAQAEIEEAALPKVDQAVEIGPRARIDLAIGYYEMGFPKRAVRELLIARGRADYQLEADFLRVTALAASGEPLTALALAEEVLRSESLASHQRLELWYQAGLACEALAMQDRAVAFFRQVIALEPHYREAARRIGNLEKS